MVGRQKRGITKLGGILRLYGGSLAGWLWRRTMRWGNRVYFISWIVMNARYVKSRQLEGSYWIREDEGGGKAVGCAYSAGAHQKEKTWYGFIANIDSTSVEDSRHRNTEIF